MIFSPHVEDVAFRFQRFRVADRGDYLSINHRSGSITYDLYRIPALDGPSGPFVVKQGGYLELLWNTDTSGNDLGYQINGVDVFCTANPSGPPYEPTFVMRNFPYDGYLLGTDDVMYLWTHQPGLYQLSILVWPVPGAGDFDMFASFTDPNPSEASHDFLSANIGDMPELIIVPKPINHETRPIYIAVGSSSGQGQFRFYVNVHKHSYRAFPVGVLTDFWPTENQRTRIKTLLRKLTQAVYFATDGREFISYYKLHWNGAQAPPGMYQTYIKFTINPHRDVCEGWPPGWCNGYGERVVYQPGVAPQNGWCGCTNCTQCHAFSHELMTWWAAGPGVHEFGHCYYMLKEEYKPTNACGHSIMGYPTAVKAGINDFCVYHNGGFDPHPGDTGHSQSENNWDCINQVLLHSYPMPDPSYSTPDAFYETADENNYDYPFSEHIEIEEFFAP